MKIFLKKVVILSLIIFLFVIAGEYVVRLGNNQYKYKHNYVKENGANIETLILGSSHTYYGIMPDLISDSAFSLANMGQPLLYDYYMLLNYESYLPSLKRVVLDIGYLSLRSAAYETKAGDKYKVYYRIFMDFPQIPKFSKSSLMCSESFIFKSCVLATYHKKEITCDEFGWGKGYDVKNQPSDWDDPADALSRHTGGKNYAKYVARNTDVVMHIAEFCKERGVELIITSMPIWHTYNENLDTKQLEDVNKVINQLQEKYNLKFYDYSNDTRFEQEDFFNVDHLSNVGAEKFSRIFADTLKL